MLFSVLSLKSNHVYLYNMNKQLFNLRFSDEIYQMPRCLEQRNILAFLYIQMILICFYEHKYQPYALFTLPLRIKPLDLDTYI